MLDTRKTKLSKPSEVTELSYLITANVFLAITILGNHLDFWNVVDRCLTRRRKMAMAKINPVRKYFCSGKIGRFGARS